MDARPLLLASLLLAMGCTVTPAVDDDDDDTEAPAVPGEACADDDEDLVRPDGWGAESHCQGADANYDLLFDDTVVRRIDITMTAANYEAGLDDREDLLGGGGGPGGGGDLDTEPMWVPVTIALDGVQWWEVGMRYKGNSSLRSAYNSGVLKVPFRLNFDKYEDDYPDLANQRFHGFKKMTFSSGFKDDSLIRDKLGADLFRAAGIPAARGSFVRVYLDHGAGPVYMGLYTMIEDPSNKMLDSQFDDDGGNLYKPDGDGAALTTFVEGDMHKKTFEEEADFSDVQALIDVLNGDRSDAEAWRTDLEAIFDVGGFLRLLAVNQTLVNWDSYGWMTHNYYLYADPSDDGRIVWFPWDLNECLLIPGGIPGGPGGGGSSDDPESVLLEGTGDGWPMIRYLLDDPIYAAEYRDQLANVLAGPLAVDSVTALMSDYHVLIEPYVVGDDGEAAPYTNLASDSSFTGALDGNQGLLAHIEDRHDAVNDALGL
ncbi:MAG: cellulosomal protein [Proteobacteria bacterium]|nr:cellulosomal protein [Pseudomonadota bacterium]